MEAASELRKEAMGFIGKVKALFLESNQTEKYIQFASALADFRAGKISSSEVLSCAKIVFEEYEDLFQEFINFLPPDLKKVQVQECQAIAFVNKVRSRFGNRNGLRVYRSFLNNMCKYKKKKKPIAEIYEEMFDLFHGHADLIHEFEGFLYDNTEDVRKEIRKKQAFAMEDRMHEIDVLLSNMNTAIQHVEGILEGHPDFVNSDFNQVELRCLERLYAQHAPQVMEKLKENPHVLLPKILHRLKQKKEELMKVRKASHEFWAELHRLRKQRRARVTCS